MAKPRTSLNATLRWNGYPLGPIAMMAIFLFQSTQPNSTTASSVTTGDTPGGLLPKTPPAPRAYAVDCINDSVPAKMTAWALQGTINQRSAKVYVVSGPWHWGQIQQCGKPFEILSGLSGPDPGLRCLFRKYQGQVKKLFIYEPRKDWTWYLALMMSAQQEGIPVTPAIRDSLASEFGWKGEVEDVRDRWPNRIAAYDWALTHLMPNCTKKVVFALEWGSELVDYVVASKGFAFWLDFDGERSEVQKILSTKGYTVGTSLMGYSNTGDMANLVANPFGIGYLPSSLFANGSFWSSFPNKTFVQPPSRALAAKPGKIYVAILWSDGGNLQFDQNALFNLWRASPHGIVPLTTTMSPMLLEINPSLLEWYYSHLSKNDELMCDGGGLQFIHVRDFKPELFAEWCRLTRIWCAGAGLRTGMQWLVPYPSQKYQTYMKTCGFEGVIGVGGLIQPGYPPRLSTVGAWSELQVFTNLDLAPPNPKAPTFFTITCVTGPFCVDDTGYKAIQRQCDRIDTKYPGRFEFLLFKDLCATIRNYYHLGTPAEEYVSLRRVSAAPDRSDGLELARAGDAEFSVADRGGERCWVVPKHKPPRFLYFAAEPKYRLERHSRVEIELEYFDSGAGDIVLEYDSSDPQAPICGAYKKHPAEVHRANKGGWETVRFTVGDPLFAGRQNAGGDFRFWNGGDDLAIRRVQVTRLGP